MSRIVMMVLLALATVALSTIQTIAQQRVRSAPVNAQSPYLGRWQGGELQCGSIGRTASLDFVVQEESGGRLRGHGVFIDCAGVRREINNRVTWEPHLQRIVIPHNNGRIDIQGNRGMFSMQFPLILVSGYVERQ